MTSNPLSSSNFIWKNPFDFKVKIDEITGLNFSTDHNGLLIVRKKTTDDVFVLEELRAAGAINLMVRPVAGPASKFITDYIIAGINPYALAAYEDAAGDAAKIEANLKAAKPVIETETGVRWTLRRRVGLIASNPDYAEIPVSSAIERFNDGLDKMLRARAIILTDRNTELVIITEVRRWLAEGNKAPNPYQPTHPAKDYTPIAHGPLPYSAFGPREHTITTGIKSQP